MNSISTPPDSLTNAGLEFNYSVWTPGTTVQLCNVPWTVDYRDIVLFDNRDKLDDYLLNGAGPVVTYNQLSYAKPNQPVTINLPFNSAYKYNYLRVYNPVQPIAGDEGRVFYYFITDVKYVAPNTTQLMVQLDVWQTFFNDVEFGRCYIERGHVGIANENANNLNGREYLTVPEGLDMGNEYTIRRVDAHRYTVNGNPYDASIVIASTVSFSQSGGTVASPKLTTAQGSMNNGVPSGAELYVCKSRVDFLELMDDLSEKPWISQGVMVAYLCPPIDADAMQMPKLTIDGKTYSGVYKSHNAMSKVEEVELMSDWRATTKSLLPTRYRHLTKFLTYPYMFFELTMHNGTPLVVKPEALTDYDFKVATFKFFTPPNPRMMVTPIGYNSYSTTVRVNADIDMSAYLGSEWLDFATGVLNFPQIPIVNNSYTSYLASNHNNIAFQHQSADWSQQRALRGNEVAFDQSANRSQANQALAFMGVETALQTTDLQNRTNLSRGVVGVAQGALSALGGNVMGGVGQAVGAGVNTAIDISQNTQQTAINNNYALRRNSVERGQEKYQRDTNKDYGDWAAQGDYSNTIAGINAKVQDAKMIQPTVSGQVGGDAFNYSLQGGYVIAAKTKMIDQAAMAIIGEYWLRYGYAVNRFGNIAKSRLLCMSKFAYWRMKETYISSSKCPEVFKQTIRGIFEKGVTVWRNPQDIATLDIGDNQPLTGISL